MLFCFTLFTPKAQNHINSFNHQKAQINALMSELNKGGQFNGSILVAKAGKLIYENGFGYADFNKKIPFTITTPCYIASLEQSDN